MRFRVELMGVLYDVKFISVYREDEFGRPTASPRGLRDTRCFISRVIGEDGDGRSEYFPVTQADARLSHRDQYNKYVGWKLAFGRAVKNLRWTKPSKLSMWEAYEKALPGNKSRVAVERTSA